MQINRRKRILFLLSLAVIFFTLFVSTAGFASAAGNEITPAPIGPYGSIGIYGVPGQYGQYGQYGGSPTATKILVDKFVGITTKGVTKCEDPNIKYVDNFLSSDPHLKSNQEICFKINIKNTSDNKLNDVKLVDFVPQFLEPVEGPGNFDKTAKTINFDIGDFNPNEERIFFIKMKVISQDKLPTDIGFFCTNNKAVASALTASDEDSSQVCIER